ncbi:deoxyuridine 5'-triphosphate nucleotidohydrolase [Candidatus Nanosalina sp. VS9-1]|uniref:deoxyuridine 5'-triphosphate nucleotidohydrolase n=1 Tax=Candidatus Nanosalina sp. VS9-1 TaxID=3388566 RepID=UPI0039E17D0C
MKLNNEQLEEAVEEGLVENFIDLDKQLTPNGFDLTAKEIHRFKESGKLDFSNSEREIPETEKVEASKKDEEDDYGWWNLEPGAYKIKTNEIVDLPEDIIGFAYPRSSLLRMGCTIENGVWDAGFRGTSEFLLIVENSEGVEIKENARVNHIVFEKIEETDQAYEGRYQEK